ncbi:hypothetical protein HWI79_629 [Cryptosporidium felis]|nr:hypothetical protein HWI79_629 [Cryptosporidium felis]
MEQVPIQCCSEVHSLIQKEPDLRCSSYYAYPEFQESVYSESEIQLKFCIRELYDFLYNKRGLGISEPMGNETLGDRELLVLISEISSIISVCMETKIDNEDSLDVHHNQVYRLKEQERNIYKILSNIGENEVLFDLVLKVSNSIQNMLFCLSKMEHNEERLHFSQKEPREFELSLTPLRIKYPYLTGTYTPLNQNDGGWRVVPSKVREVNKKELKTEFMSSYTDLSDEKALELAERAARISLRNKINKQPNCLEDYKITKSSINDFNSVDRKHSLDSELTSSQFKKIQTQNQRKAMFTDNEEVSEKFLGGATRLIVDSSQIKEPNSKYSIMMIDGWGLIEHHSEQEREKNFSDSEKLLKKELTESPSQTQDGSKIAVIDKRAHRKGGNYPGSVRRDPKKNLTSDTGSGNTNTSSFEEKSEKGNESSVRKLKNRFERESERRNYRKIIEEGEADVEIEEEANGIVGKTKRDKIISACSSRKGKAKQEYSKSFMPSQFTSTRQFSSFKETMYSTSSWLPLSRNTGFNYDCLNSNPYRNSERHPGTEYDPAAEYARFSDAVGKVIHPIIADESYRDNGKNVMNPKKLFNAKFGTLTEDTFKEIQEKLRIKMEGWTIHGSGLQDPRAEIFWDPAVMTAASSVSPFYTNMPSSNSPLLTNTLIPTNNGVSKRTGFLETLGVSRLALQKGQSKSGKTSLTPESDPIESESRRSTSVSQSPPNANSHNPEYFPVKSMKDLPRRWNQAFDT